MSWHEFLEMNKDMISLSVLFVTIGRSWPHFAVATNVPVTVTVVLALNVNVTMVAHHQVRTTDDSW
jgi:hypothetical protein